MPPGIVSNWLHDHASPDTVLKVAPPAGEFFLDEKDDGPVVLLSGGRRPDPDDEHAGSDRRFGQRPADLVRARRGERPPPPPCTATSVSHRAENDSFSN